MEVTLEELDLSTIARGRQAMTPIHEKMMEIQEKDEVYAKRLLKLATFKLPAEKGRANTTKQNMVNAYGNSPAVTGFRFSVTRSVEGDEEYLCVFFNPDQIVSGAYDEWQDERDAKVEKAKVRKAEKERERKIAAALSAKQADEDETEQMLEEVLS